MHRQALEMLWRGSDDLREESDIFTHKLFDGFRPPPGFCFGGGCSDPMLTYSDTLFSNIDERANKFIESILHRQAPSYNTSHVMVMMGATLAYYEADMWFGNIDTLILKVNERSRKKTQPIHLMYSSPACYLKAVHKENPILETKQDDFLPLAYDQHSYSTGLYSSRPSMKYLAREGHVFLQMSKQLHFLARLVNNEEKIEELQWITSAFQDHKVITGALRSWVQSYYTEKMHVAIQKSTLILKQAFNKLRGCDPEVMYYRCTFNESSCLASYASDYFVVVYNPLAWNVSIPVRLPTINNVYRVFDPQDKEVSSALLRVPQPVLGIPGRSAPAQHELVFMAEELPALGFRSYYIQATPKRRKRRAKRPERKGTLIKKLRRTQKKYLTRQISPKEIEDREDFIDNYDYIDENITPRYGDSRLDMEETMQTVADIKQLNDELTRNNSLMDVVWQEETTEHIRGIVEDEDIQDKLTYREFIDKLNKMDPAIRHKYENIDKPVRSHFYTSHTDTDINSDATNHSEEIKLINKHKEYTKAIDSRKHAQKETQTDHDEYKVQQLEKYALKDLSNERKQLDKDNEYKDESDKAVSDDENVNKANRNKKKEKNKEDVVLIVNEIDKNKQNVEDRDSFSQTQDDAIISDKEYYRTEKQKSQMFHNVNLYEINKDAESSQKDDTSFFDIQNLTGVSKKSQNNILVKDKDALQENENHFINLNDNNNSKEIESNYSVRDIQHIAENDNNFYESRTPAQLSEIDENTVFVHSRPTVASEKNENNDNMREDRQNYLPNKLQRKKYYERPKPTQIFERNENNFFDRQRTTQSADSGNDGETENENYVTQKPNRKFFKKISNIIGRHKATQDSEINDDFTEKPKYTQDIENIDNDFVTTQKDTEQYSEDSEKIDIYLNKKQKDRFNTEINKNRFNKKYEIHQNRFDAKYKHIFEKGKGNFFERQKDKQEPEINDDSFTENSIRRPLKGETGNIFETPKDRQETEAQDNVTEKPKHRHDYRKGHYHFKRPKDEEFEINENHFTVKHKTTRIFEPSYKNSETFSTQREKETNTDYVDTTTNVYTENLEVIHDLKPNPERRLQMSEGNIQKFTPTYVKDEIPQDLHVATIPTKPLEKIETTIPDSITTISMDSTKQDTFNAEEDSQATKETFNTEDDTQVSKTTSETSKIQNIFDDVKKSKADDEVEEVDEDDSKQNRTKEEMEVLKKGEEKRQKSMENDESADLFISNEYITVDLEPESRKASAMRLSNGLQMTLDVQFYYFASDMDMPNQQYVKRPPGNEVMRSMDNFVTPILDYLDVRVYKTKVVEEVHYMYGEWASLVLRLYADRPVLEVDWLVGPVPVDDGIGKDVFVRYMTNLVNYGEFYTDANGRQTVKRIRNARPMFFPFNKDQAGNYYPVTSKIYIEDLVKNMRLSIFTDRCQAGTSLYDGEVDLVLHRRILTDDENIQAYLNETDSDGNGIRIRGKHYIYLSKANYKPNKMFEKRFAKEIELKPQVFVSNNQLKSTWISNVNELSFLKSKLPVGIHLLTLEEWNEGTLLLRLENYLEKSDISKTGVKVVFIRHLFEHLRINEIKETMLGANIWKEDYVPKQWEKKEKFMKNFNLFYGNLVDVEYAEDHFKKNQEIDIDRGISLSPQQIRTFVCWFTYLYKLE